MEHLRVLGCLCYAKVVQETDKLQTRTRMAVHMGYSDVQKGYILYNLSNHVFFVNRDVAFREEVFPFQTSTSSPAPVYVPDEYSNSPAEPQTSPTHRSSTESSIVVPNNPNLSINDTSNTESTSEGDSTTSATSPPMETNDAATIRRSTREKNPPIWLKDFVTLNVHKDVLYAISNYVSYERLTPKYQAYIAAFSSIVEPNTYEEASRDPRWIEAMKFEIAALEDNHTWGIVSLSAGKHPIGCK